MSLPFPYTYISCPCSDESNRVTTSQRGSRDLSQEDEGPEEEKTFNPHDPRSNYSLFPPEYLLYCEECHEIKCPRCATEEIVCWYCPSCLFETPSSMVRSEGNRSDFLPLFVEAPIRLTLPQMCSQLLQLPGLYIPTHSQQLDRQQRRPLDPELQLLHVDLARDRHQIRQAHQHPIPTRQDRQRRQGQTLL